MNILNSDTNIDDFLSLKGKKLMFVSSPSCKHCRTTESLLNDSAMTLSACFDYVGKFDFKNGLNFCHKYEIESTPTLIAFDEESVELGRMNFAPEQDEFFDWITVVLF